MADHDNHEVARLRGLVVKLSREIDHKNHLLMEKEGLSLEKFATMSSLLEEKDRLLDERSDVIGTLMVQNCRLHEAHVEGEKFFKDAKLELEKVKHDLEVEKCKRYPSTGELVVYQARKDDGPGTLTTTRPRTRKSSMSPQINRIVQAKSDDSRNKHDREQKSLVLYDGTLERRSLAVHNEELKTQIDNLKRELDEKAKANKLPSKKDCDQRAMVKIESIDYDFGSLSNPMEPLRKKLKESKSRNAKDQSSSKSDNGKLTR